VVLAVELPERESEWLARAAGNGELLDLLAAAVPCHPAPRLGRLSLTRRAGQAILIKNNILVTILEIRGGQVKMGFEAPTSVGIVRLELLGKGDGLARDARGESPD
jgi:carbon storage regulator CsrA